MRRIVNLCLYLVISGFILSNCSVLEEQFIPGNEIKVNLTMERDNYSLEEASIENSVEPIVIHLGDSIRINEIESEFNLEIGDLKIEETDNENVSYRYSETPIPGGVEIPELELSAEFTNIPDGGAEDFNYALVDTGSFFLNIKNNFSSLTFDSIRYSLKNNEGSIVFSELIEDLSPNEEENRVIKLDDKKITPDMVLDTKMYNKAVSGDDNDGLDNDDNLALTYNLGECSFTEANARFDGQTMENDSIYVVDMENVTVRSVIFKAAKMCINMENNTDLNIHINSEIPSMYNLKTNEIFRVPEITGMGLVDEIVDIDSVKLNSDLEKDGEIGIRVRTEASFETGFITVRNDDEIKMSITIASDNSEDEKVEIYEVDGKFTNEEFEIEEEADLDDVDWEDQEGVVFENVGVKMLIDLIRDDLFFERLSFKELKLQGVKNGNEFSEEKIVNVEDLVHFNRDSVVIDHLEDIINFHPEKILYKGLTEADFDGVIKHTDSLRIDLKIGSPLNATIDHEVLFDESVQEVDKLVDDEDIEVHVDYFKLDALIDNPSLDMKCSLFVDISTDKEHLSDVKNMFNIAFIKNPNNKPNGYLLSSIREDGEMVSIAPEIVDMMIENDTFIKTKIKVEIPDGSSITTEDSIGVQLKFDGLIQYEINK